MKHFLFALSLAVTTFISTAQPKTTQLKKVLELQMPEGPGARASSIVWQPVTKKYYAPMSGNADHAFAIFNAQGKRISKGTETALFDVRGLWYDPQSQKICSNGYDGDGWVSYKLDTKGTPVGTVNLFHGMNQPDKNSVGSFDSKNKQLYFLSGQMVVVYDAKTAEEKDRIRLHVGSASEEDAYASLDEDDDSETPDSYNYTTVIYTGIPKAEFALLNHSAGKIELYDKATGYITQILDLPLGIIGDEMLCFSYANGIYWIYDRDKRVWKGCK
jgi:hypothetical protein